MSRTVDLVIVAGDSCAIPVAVDAARRGIRVLVVIRSPRVRLMRRLRRALRAAGPRVRRGVTIFTNAEVVCVDGLDRVEAVIVRRIGTGRLIGVNATAIQMVGGANEASSVRTVNPRARHSPGHRAANPASCLADRRNPGHRGC